MFPEKALTEIFRVTKPGGYIYLSFPLEQTPMGKHVSAIPSAKALKRLLHSLDVRYEVLVFDRAAALHIIPDPKADELVFYARKRET
jgi:ubiquinone/menaquinone biosynthesis C-methylase UbiE